MAKKKQASAPTPKPTFDFNKITIAEIVAILGKDVCDQSLDYLSYGTDLEAAWKVLITNNNHLNTMMNALGVSKDRPNIPTLVSAFKEAFKKPDDYPDSLIMNALYRQYSPDSFKEGLKEKIEVSFPLFRKSLFAFCKRRLKEKDIAWVDFVGAPTKA